MGLTNSWGDEIDEELKNKKKLTTSFSWNFISTNHMITRFDHEVGEINEEYPKNEIQKMWASTLIMMLLFGLLWHSALVIIALPFLLLYGMLLFKFAKLLKRFGYSTGMYWVWTILALAAIVGANFLLWNVLLN